MRFTRDYSGDPPKVRRIKIVRDIFAAAVMLMVLVSFILHLCGFHAAAELIETIIGIAISVVAYVGVTVWGIVTAVKAFRQKRTGAGIFLALMSLTIPTVILLAVTEKGRALVLYILEGY